ncbi:MAG: hypothetical protein QOD74_3031 [Variibacter sp.]|nr:hypothetical protein [Variibacter sp.]
MAQGGRRAIVIGGSMSGLLAGLFLRQRGWDVDIFERVADELSGRGAGIVAQPQLVEACRALGISLGEPAGVATWPRRTFDRDGKLIAETECPQVHTTWERVFRSLRSHFPAERYHRGVRLAHLEQESGVVHARFEDGSAREADLLIGADGLRSSVRTVCAPDPEPSYAGYVAWRALIDEAAMSPATHGDIFPCMAFCLPEREQCLGYPVAGPNDDLRPGHRRYNLVWYRPTDEEQALPRLLTDETGTQHHGAIPPPLIRRAVITELHVAAERLLAPQFREVISLARPFLQPIYDFVTPRMVYGRVVLIGDAAFVARPHVGGGVVKAAQDAMALGAVLDPASEVSAALRRFEAQRMPAGRRMVERGRELGALIEPSRCNESERAFAAANASPEALMTHTAVLDFLEA